MKTERYLAVLDSYAQLSDGWDGDDSKAPNLLHLDWAKKLIQQLPAEYEPKPMLSSNGAVGLYWVLGQMYAELEFSDQLILELYKRKATGYESYGNIKLAFNDALIDGITIDCIVQFLANHE
jgi:hypothetical protein